MCMLNTGFIVEALQSEGSEPVAYKPVVGKTQHKGEPRHINEMIGTVRAALTSMGGGDISFSPYDTAWVALLKKLDGAEGPQFPSCIDWIAKNQLPDGSWGDDAFFLVQDRLIKTLASRGVTNLPLGLPPPVRLPRGWSGPGAWSWWGLLLARWSFLELVWRTEGIRFCLSSSTYARWVSSRASSVSGHCGRLHRRNIASTMLANGV
ncbi:hypothetical protein PAHAL_1G276200 [Panicum hallii]|uniref:Squalene cyclase N-terminal domain-containing protein n=1 Tax=Panicum hallii TaxID=206008 RepID=A0A2S3GQK1_9POAL|nr:uncharacterized protein LOC112879144 [Panicum hallii]XP_025799264.1 uncharacterized protein LOC112879144 [Panicum hallii]PAN06613.1 hypothetical protein PAHAL_1G276200 [Panicum hallii]PAN06615.1 hypothetical protein PAHAL_1G276200 [Panicum hallii]PVH66541.1 hypothetical protein PAHAL_1G276200 [Panicum hallii]